MRRKFEIARRIAWGFLELAIVIYVLSAIDDRNTSLIISTLGLIYATIRFRFLFFSRGLHLGPLVADDLITFVFLGLVYLICLMNLFWKL